ncbi:MAG: PHP domain-containing protein [Oscillospiraceae bacterium]|nr:PHP domain-containing protein [Oscillospiraceae bacterium]
MRISDMHNHTLYSYDSVTRPEELAENALEHGLGRIGISDHQFTVRDDFFEYVSEINTLKRKYLGRTEIMCGLEIGTRPKPDDFLASCSSYLDYCLFESLDSERGMDFFEFIEWQKLFKCRKGLAHTDVFALEKKYRTDILKIMAENDIFWEINISGNYSCYYDFITNTEKQYRIAGSGVRISIGSDNHRISDFNMNKLIGIHKLVKNLGLHNEFD